MSKKSNKKRKKLLKSLKRGLKNPFSYLMALVLALIVLATYVVSRRRPRRILASRGSLTQSGTRSSRSSLPTTTST